MEISVLTLQDAEESLDLVSEEFAIHSPLHRALAVSGKEYREHLSPGWQKHVDERLSLVARDSQSGELTGVLVATRYPTDFSGALTASTRLAPIAELLRRLEQAHIDSEHYRPANRLLIDLAVVRDSAKRQGIYTALRSECHRVAQSAGFDRVVGELSSSETQRHCINQLGHRVLAEILYADFDFQNQRPFATIEQPRSILLVEGSLKQ